MTVLFATVLGVIEGFTEFLPVSSTGHLILASSLLHLAQTEFLKSFEIVIQLGAILAVVWLYGKTLIFSRVILKNVFVAFLPAAVIGGLSYKFIKSVLIGNTSIVLWAFLIGGITLILFELLHREKETAAKELSAISAKQAFVIGCFQVLAMIPGVSRAAATIIGGLLVGINRKTVVEFSFLLAIPTMAAATGLDLLRSAHAFSLPEYGLLTVGFAAAFLSAIAAVKFLLAYIQRHTFIGFGIYRIAAALLFWTLI